MLKFLMVPMTVSVVSTSAFAAEKCASRVKPAVTEWAAEIFESDNEDKKEIGSAPVTIEIGAPELKKKDKVPANVYEGYSVDWKLKFKDQVWDYSGLYFFDSNCHRMKTAENKAGKEIEKKMKESN